ncbi:transient receptor potential channel pyrexia-like [Gigaspora margarita]|uniref:Transient receptor potential channel pyrexia-like n=1 Tax=Gigaspora margarita TaxID=4874 RepID=A0A8H4ANF4_GIGMA|nr:transient receptor potential channel pyrexia-like [Gigaspora margarita]
MSNKSSQESIINIEDEDGDGKSQDGKSEDVKDGNEKELYLATSPVGDFVVEFVLLSCESSESSESSESRETSESSESKWKCKFRMYNVEPPKKNENMNLKDNKKLSYRNLSKIDTSKQEPFKFTKEQSDLITSEDKLSWSVAVSDKLYQDKSVKLHQDKPHQSTVRLLAISCTSKHDMTYNGSKSSNDSKNPNDSKNSNGSKNSNDSKNSKNPNDFKNSNNSKNSNDSENSNNSGFTIVFFIKQDTYSVDKILTLDNYGGKVKLFSKYKDNKGKPDEKNTDKSNQNNNNGKTNEDYQTLDRFFLVILNVTGIHKYYFKNLNKCIKFFKILNKCIKLFENSNKCTKHFRKIQRLIIEKKIRSFKYPKRIYNGLNKNKKFGPEFNQKYIQKCLNLHYFLVDTSDEGAQYIELYDLRTNQLVNTFKRQNLNSLNLIADIPDNIAISNNNKLLAYSSGNKVNLYLIESGLEIASIELKLEKVLDDDDFDYFMHFFNEDERLLIYRSKNQWAIWDIFGLEQKSIMLKNYLSDYKLEFDLKTVNILSDHNYQLERSNSFVIIVKNKEENEETKFSEDRQIYDDLISYYLKRKSDQQNFNTLNLEAIFKEATNEKQKSIIFGLDDEKSELDKYYHTFEPWLYLSEVKEAPQYSVYLDEKKEILLLIGNHTIQVWHDRAKKDQAKQDQDKQDQTKQEQAKQEQAQQDQDNKIRTLEFISVIAKNENKSDKNKEIECAVRNIDEIKYANRKFKISFKDSKSVEIGCDNDVINTVREACHALKFLNSIYHTSIKYSRSLIYGDRHSKFKEIVKQTRNIVVRFIQLHPITWRLLGVRFDLLSILIEAEEDLLIKHILFNEKKDIDGHEKRMLRIDHILTNSKINKHQLPHDIKPDDSLLHEKSLHMPQYFSWEGKENTICKAFNKAFNKHQDSSCESKENTLCKVFCKAFHKLFHIASTDHSDDDDPIYLGYLLEYYSNKAVEDIRWMISVGKIIPELYDKSHENGFFKSFIQLLFYKSCFCDKGLDIPFFDFIVIPPSISNSLEVFIPITQLIPLDSDLKVEEISKEKIPDVQMVPLIDFATNIKRTKGHIYIKYLKSVLLPNIYLPLDMCCMPFLSLIDKVEENQDDLFYSNPSAEAIMNFMWHASKSHWHNKLYMFIIYFLSYSIITWMYIAHIQITGDFEFILVFVIIILFFYLTYYQFVTEFNQVLHKGWRYLKDPFNWMDLFSLILPLIISVYILVNYFSIEYGFKYAESNLYLAFIIFISIIDIWYELVLLLRIFPGFAHYLNILYNIVAKIRLFLIFFALTIIAMGHALFIFLGYAAYIGLSESPTTYEVMNGSSVVYNMTEETPENLFSNPFNAIISAYDWDTIALSTWGFWPLAIISVLGNIVFIVILQNVIISFMSAAFESAEKDGKKAVLNFQSRLINEYAHLEYSAFTSGRSNFENKLKKKLKVKYVCFFNEPTITKAWSDESKDWKSTPIYSNAESQIPTETECKFDIENDYLQFIWAEKTTDNDVNNNQ